MSCVTNEKRNEILDIWNICGALGTKIIILPLKKEDALVLFSALSVFLPRSPHWSSPAPSSSSELSSCSEPCEIKVYLTLSSLLFQNGRFRLWIWTRPFFVNRGFSQWSLTIRQAVQILMRWLIMSHLIWIYTVCVDICTSLKGWKGSD